MKEWRQVATPEKPIRYKIEEIPSSLQPVALYLEKQLELNEAMMAATQVHADNISAGTDEWDEEIETIFWYGQVFREGKAALRALVTGDSLRAQQYLQKALDAANDDLASLEKETLKNPEILEVLNKKRTERDELQVLFDSCQQETKR